MDTLVERVFTHHRPVNCQGAGCCSRSARAYVTVVVYGAVGSRRVLCENREIYAASARVWRVTDTPVRATAASPRRC
jgi:hypothetical protein